MKIVSLYGRNDLYHIPFDLLSERLPSQSISHHEMPTWDQHLQFIDSHPYPYWYVCYRFEVPVGCVYLTKQREIGIGIFKAFQRKGYAKLAIYELMQMHPGKFLANINPDNEASIKLFQNFGFRHIQNTYAKD